MDVNAADWRSLAHRTMFTAHADCPRCGATFTESRRLKPDAVDAVRSVLWAHVEGHAGPNVVCVSTRPSVGAA